MNDEKLKKQCLYLHETNIFLNCNFFLASLTQKAIDEANVRSQNHLDCVHIQIDSNSAPS